MKQRSLEGKLGNSAIATDCSSTFSIRHFQEIIFFCVFFLFFFPSGNYRMIPYENTAAIHMYVTSNSEALMQIQSFLSLEDH